MNLYKEMFGQTVQIQLDSSDAGSVMASELADYPDAPTSEAPTLRFVLTGT